MGWRTIYIQSASKLSLNLDNVQIMYEKQKYYVAIDELETIVIEDYRTLITARLIAKLCEEGVNVIFCKNNKMPVGAIHAFNNNSKTAKINLQQLELGKSRKKNFWKQIIEIKIKNQIHTLSLLRKDSTHLKKYVKEVKSGDITNREGLAAREYFRMMFGKDFIRFEDDIVNFTLNYIYQIMRSKIAQAIVARGLHPPFGIFHHGLRNYYNLADDLIEPYRPIADYYAYKLLDNYDKLYLTPEFKEKIVDFLNYKILISGKNMSVQDSLELYFRNILNFYEGKTEKISAFPKVKENGK